VPKHFPDLLRSSILLMLRDQAAGENLQAKIPIAKSLGRSASRRQNKLSTEDLSWSGGLQSAGPTWKLRLLERIARVHAESLRKIAAFANDRADLCRTHNRGRSARKRECERKDVELGPWRQPCSPRRSRAKAGRLRCLRKQPARLPLQSQSCDSPHYS
jgi:hypothetical protein